ncbi:MAG: alpha-galactosidase [Verrucomicrobiales bacterium]|jgi:raffinose synthase|nr:alpha-galactosidase [Verrucomicrobiales bacterium]
MQAITSLHSQPGAFLTPGRDYAWVTKNCPNNGGFLRATRALARPRENLGALRLHDLKRWVAVGAFASPYWNRVRHGAELPAIPPQTHYLLWERTDGRYGILLPLVAGDYVFTVSGARHGVRLRADGGKAAPLKAGAAIAYTATGDDVCRLVSDAMRAVAHRLKSFNLRADKVTPAFVDYLGWCTWNACYHDVSTEKILAGVASLRKGGVTPGFVLLDDGWQDVRDDQLHGFSVNRQRFPDGFGAAVVNLRQLGVRYFGVWHALQGYWLGVADDDGVGSIFDLYRDQGVIRPWLDGGKKRETIHLIHPRQARRFFDHYHGMLKAQGVDLLKVDVQSVLATLAGRHFGRASAMRRYQRALQASAARHFHGNLIHCMANTPDVAYNYVTASVWRNTDDFIPDLTAGHQQEHIHTNAINNLFTATFALPDWDMFQSHHQYAEYHAAARALSGGTVYISDQTGRENFTVIRKIAADDGRVYRCDRPALPCADSIFTDCRVEPALLKIHNRAGAIGLLGFFHCSAKNRQLTAAYNPADIPGLTGSDFIAYHHTLDRLQPLKPGKGGTVTLPFMGFEIVTLSPVLAGWLAPIGRAGRYVGATSLGSVTVSADRATVTVRESGQYLIWSARRPVRVTFNDEPIPYRYHLQQKLLKIPAPAAGKLEIQIS